MTDRIEAKLAELERLTDDLSGLVAVQADRIDTLERRIAWLLDKEAERQADATGGVVLGDERPPHW